MAMVCVLKRGGLKCIIKSKWKIKMENQNQKYSHGFQF